MASGITLKSTNDSIVNIKNVGTTTGTTEVTVPNTNGTLATSDFMHARDEKASGTAGGSSSAGSQIRTLNTVVHNSISGASLASNQITLPSGKYHVKAIAPASKSLGHRLRLVNVTDSTVAILGVSGHNDASADYGHSPALLEGRVEITSTKVFNLTHYITNAIATDGLGKAVSDTFVEVFASIIVTKVG